MPAPTTNNLNLQSSTSSIIIYTKTLKKRVRWIVGLGVPTTSGNEPPLALSLRTRTLAGMRDVTPICYQMGSLSTICELSDYLGSRQGYYQYIQSPSAFDHPSI